MTELSNSGNDIINRLAGIAPDSPLASLRAQRPEVAHYAQTSFAALLEPEDEGGVPRVERYLVGLRIATLTGAFELTQWLEDRLPEHEIDKALQTAVIAGPASDGLSPRLEAILRHTDRLSLAPANATAAHIAELTDAGLSPRDIVTISQLISFLSFQVRTLIALRLLSEQA